MDYNNVMAEALGADFGLAKEDLAPYKNIMADVHKDLMSRRKLGELPFYDLPFAVRELRRLRKAADELRRKADNFVVLGIGGSAMGAGAVFNATGVSLNHNMVDRAKRRFPALRGSDNIGPEGMAALLSMVESAPETMLTMWIGRQSGTTAEIFGPVHVHRDQFKKISADSSLKDHSWPRPTRKRGCCGPSAKRWASRPSRCPKAWAAAIPS
jgi:glucose-6-phosphate isomerase